MTTFANYKEPVHTLARSIKACERNKAVNTFTSNLRRSATALWSVTNIATFSAPACGPTSSRFAIRPIEWLCQSHAHNVVTAVGLDMPTETTYTNLRQNLASVLDQVVDQQETVIVRRRGSRDVALIPAGELAGLMETAHLLRSPRNARRLLTALSRSGRGSTKPSSAAKLRRETLGGTGR